MLKVGRLLLNNGNIESVTWELNGMQGHVRGHKKPIKVAARDGSAVLSCPDGATLAIRVYDYENGRAAFTVLLARVPIFVAQTVSEWGINASEFRIIFSDEDGNKSLVVVPLMEMQRFLTVASRLFAANPSAARFVKDLMILSVGGQHKVSLTLDNGDHIDLLTDDAREMGLDLIAHADLIDKQSRSSAA